MGSDLLECLAYWDETCCWTDNRRCVCSTLLRVRKRRTWPILPLWRIIASRWMSCQGWPVR
ncbi:MAG: hypothetical protein IJ438_01850 [Clostridia bacterium]|nr:hypothetical protein [Clostridia bacterium]